ncbi:unnamed protein product [Heterobilharzia americana]|nr:unnamed protein product [Heterobilharzia americana]
MFIYEGAHVLLRKENCYKFVKISSKKKETFDGKEFSLKNSIGLPFGSTFLVSGDQIQPTTYKSLMIADAKNSSSLDDENKSDENELKDNRNIKGSQDNQKLTGSCIEQLRLSGISGQDILDQIVEGSTTFEQKTTFSQQKYLKKKKNRHLSLFSIEKPNARIIFETYGSLRPEKCLGLRFDTVCRILSYANIHAGSTVLLCETCGGLITTAVLERIGIDEPEGLVIQFYHGSSPPKSEIVPLSGSIYTKRVYPVRLLDVMPILLYKASQHDNNDSNSGSKCTTGEDSESLTKIRKVDEDLSPVEQEQSENQKISKKHNTNESYLTSFSYIFGSDRPSADCLVIVTRYHPVDLTLCLLQFLLIGRPFVVYSHIFSRLLICTTH